MGQYRFYLSFENSLCKDYVTEKFFKLFSKAYGEGVVIPVTRGGADYDNFFPPGSFVNAAHFKSPKQLALYLKKLSDNVEEYTNMLRVKLRYEKMKDFGVNGFRCELCEFLNKRDPNVLRMYDHGKLVDTNDCHKPTDLVG